MNFKSKLVSVVGAGIIALSMVGGAGAQTAANVNVQVEAPTNGTLTAMITAGEFGKVTTSMTESKTSSGTLTLTVTDNRFTREGWTVTASGTNFTNGNYSIPVGSLRVEPQQAQAQWKAGDNTQLPQARGMTMTDQGQVAMTVQRGSGSGKYEMTYNGVITVPANTQPGTYQSTITINATSGPQ